MQANGEPTPLIGVVFLKLPPFWPADPALWFAYVESLFATRGISSQVTKFHYVVSALSPSEAAEVRDIIMTPPRDVPYDRLKHELVKRTTASEQRRLRQLLTEEEQGNRKPRTGTNVSRSEQESCRKLCNDCGLGVRREIQVHSETCNCKFLWCCSVKCDTCPITVQRHFCT
ncbi:protein Wnt-8a [Ixodes scapularis]